MNKKGLAVGLFYFPGFAKYAEATAQNKDISLSPSALNHWLLSQFATFDEVRAGLGSVAIILTTRAGWPVLPPARYVVCDKTSASMVIEPIDGKLVVHDNPLGVVSNSPPFDWHMTNLSKYVNMLP